MLHEYNTTCDNASQGVLTKFGVLLIIEHTRRCNTMQKDSLQPQTVTKTIRFEKELVEKIEKLREGTERNFSQQVKYMLKKYIDITEK